MSAVNWSAPFEELCQGQAIVTPGRTVTEADVVGFAALTGDWHPQHADATWAAAGRFGERIAHGMLIVSYTVGLMPLDPERVIALRRVSDVIFKLPVRLADTIRAEGRIAELVPIDDEAGLVRCALSVRNQHDDLVCRLRLDVLWTCGVPSGRRGELRAAGPLQGQSGSETAEPRQPVTYSPGVFPC
jgi:acyl dehydratase